MSVGRRRTPHRHLLATDLDGTLIPDGSARETPGVRERLAALIETGSLGLAYVTGRDRTLVEEAIESWRLPEPDLVIGDVGTSIHAVRAGGWDQLGPWTAHLASQWPGGARDRLEDGLAGVGDLELQEAEKQGPFKLSFYCPMGGGPVLERVERALRDTGVPHRVAFSVEGDRSRGLIDVLPERGGKRNALEFVRGHLGLTPEGVVFAGDSGNDLDVLCSSVPSVLVANAAGDIRAAAHAAALAAGNGDRLYVARGDWHGLNGNYAAGVLEGLAHFWPWTEELAFACNR